MRRYPQQEIIVSVDGKFCLGALEFSSYQRQSCVRASALGFTVVGDFEKSLSLPLNMGLWKSEGHKEFGETCKHYGKTGIKCHEFSDS